MGQCCGMEQRVSMREITANAKRDAAQGGLETKDAGSKLNADTFKDQ